MKRSFRAVPITLALLGATVVVPIASQGAGASGTHSTMIVLVRSSSTHGIHANARAMISSEVRSGGGSVLESLGAVNELIVSVTPAQARALAANPNVVAIAPQGYIRGPKLTNYAHYRANASHATTIASPTLCGTAGSPQLNPEAITSINAPSAWSQGATGAGISVGFMADGVDPSNPDFQRNAAYASTGSSTGSPVITSYQDFSGDGTSAPTSGGEAFLDSSSIAAQGNTTYDLYDYTPTMPLGCDIRVVGAAPGANVVALKVFGSSNLSTNTGFVEAINYAAANGVKVLNESFGSNGLPDMTNDIIRAANDAAVAAGVTVVVSSGDAGVTNTIGSPASDPNVIAVGASTTFRSYAQTAFGGITIGAPIASGGIVNDNISSLSSGGVTAGNRTVDLVAPGDLNWALCSSDPNYADCGGGQLENSGGTSESSPLVAGAAADVIQAYRSAHSGSYPSPAVVKSILTSTARDISADPTQQGAGLLDIGAAVALAKHVALHSTTAGGVLTSTNALSLAGAPGTKITSSIKFSNDSSTKAAMTFTARQLQAFGGESGTVTMDPSTTSTQPTFPIWSGASEIYQTANFTIPVGTATAQFQANFAYTQQNSYLHIALFDPSGNLAGYSLSQGLANYITIEQASPTPGKWTALFFTVSDNNSPTSIGTSGTVAWQTTYSAFATAKAAASVSIKANSSATVNFKNTLPTTPGDYSFEIVAATSGHSIVIPVTERVSVPVVGGLGNFSGFFTGGNGRAGAPAESIYYNFDVPAGQKNMEVDLEFAPFQSAGVLPGTQIVGALIGPNGQMVAYDTNFTLNNEGAPIQNPYLSLFAAAPPAGQYQLVLFVENPVAVQDLYTFYKGQILFNGVSVTSTLPRSASKSVSAASGELDSVTVTNNSFVELYLGADARTNANTTMSLSDFNGAPATQSFNNYWQYFLPPQTSSITSTITSSMPASFDMGSQIGDPDVSPQVAVTGLTGSVGVNTATLTYAPSGGISSGVWALVPAPLGPFTTTPVGSGTVTVNTSIVAKGFDSDVTTQIGDFIPSLMATGSPGANGFLLAPGQSATFGVAINPTASVGSVESGTLSLDSFSLGYFAPELVGTPQSISVLSVLPYKYTVAP